MRILSVLFVCVLFFSSCDLNKYTKVYIDNQNDFPIEVGIKTNNIETVYRVEAKGTIDTLRKFTDITLEDGQWEVTLKNAQTSQLIKKHSHGQFWKGDLSNGFEFKTKGNMLQFSVDM